LISLWPNWRGTGAAASDAFPEMERRVCVRHYFMPTEKAFTGLIFKAPPTIDNLRQVTGRV